MPCLHVVSAARFLVLSCAWTLAVYVLGTGGARQYVEAAVTWPPPEELRDVPLWAVRLGMLAAWVALPMLLLVHCSQFGLSTSPCLAHPNYCLAVYTAPFLLWSGCSCCGVYNDAIAVYHDVRIPPPR